MEEHHELPKPGFTPYYNEEFFRIIKDVKDNTPLNPLYMSVKMWYKFLVEKKVTMREINDEGRPELVPCKIEERNPEVIWPESYRLWVEP